MGSVAAGTQPAHKIEQIYAPILEDLKRTEKLFEDVLATDNTFVLDMVKHLGQNLGKRVRSALVMLSYRACLKEFNETHPSYREALVVAEGVELIHNATLVHDDVIDDSPTRRGQKTLNYMWGNEVTVLMGDFIFARVFGLLARHVVPEVIQTISLATDRLCEGEIQEVRARFLVTQNVADYFDIIEKKTAALMAVACESAGMVAKAPEPWITALKQYGLKVGVAFQVADDLLDLEAPAERLGKPNGHDLREGKMTLPVLFALSQAPKEEKNRVQELLLRNEISDMDLARAVDFIKKHGGLDHARAKCLELVAEAKAALAPLPESQAKRCLFDLADYIVQRDY